MSVDDSTLFDLRILLDDHLEDLVDARDRPESWQKLWALEMMLDWALVAHGLPRRKGIRVWWDRDNSR